MDESNVFNCGWWRLDQFGVEKRTLGQQTISNQFEFSDGEDMSVADVGVVALCVKDSHETDADINGTLATEKAAKALFESLVDNKMTWE